MRSDGVGCPSSSLRTPLQGGQTIPPTGQHPPRTNQDYHAPRGAALRIEAAALREAIKRNIVLRSLLLRYEYLFSLQIAHTAAANAHGSIVERLARWLLMAHDRVDGDTLHLTQEISLDRAQCPAGRGYGCAEQLQSRRSIATGRASITVVDREALHKDRPRPR